MQRFPVLGRLSFVGLVVLAIAAIATMSASGAATGSSSTGDYPNSDDPLCVQHPALCVEKVNPWTYDGETYVSGHDEPSVLFYSNKQGSGNSNQYRVTLPSDPATPPTPGGGGTIWNFQLRPAYWFGMAMCDDQSAPDPGKPCRPDSDRNIKTSTDPNSPNYLGKTPGTAFMEMQFYPPGWGPIACTDGQGNTDGKWCSALTIDSDQENENTGQQNNEACNDIVGPEPVNFAYVTKSGQSSAPANPFTPFGSQADVTADTLEYNNGDKLIVNMHDTKAGFEVQIKDLTTGQSGSMTASVQNGFGHALFEPDANSCTLHPYAFHPMYSTSSPSTRVLWAAHSYNVAASDEIGHFEDCNTIEDFSCTSSNEASSTSTEDDDFPCFTAPLVGPNGATENPGFNGCIGEDDDYDGTPYQGSSWPGGPGAVAGNVPTPFRFTSPLFATSGWGKQNNNYKQVAFETDLPRIEGTDFSTTNDCQRHISNPADPSPGSGCVNPPNGPNGPAFYPLYTTTNMSGTCIWQQGGANIPGTTNTFGGSSTTEYGGLLNSPYPNTGFTITERYNNFRNILSNNPCPASTKSGWNH
jgi:hypothetical protein